MSKVLLLLLTLVAISGLSFACGDGEGGDQPPGGSASEAASSQSEDADDDAGDGDSEVSVPAGIRTARGESVQAFVSNFSGGGGGSVGNMALASGAGGVGSGPSSVGGEMPQSGSESNSLQQEARGGLTVEGYGTAEQDADGALLDFQFGRPETYNPNPYPPAPSPIEESRFQAVIDALVAAGVPADAIEMKTNSGYYDYWSPIVLSATIDDLGVLDAAADAGAEAARGVSGLTFQQVLVTYTVDDCQSLRRAALSEAAADADERAELLADALGVGQGPVDAASDYSWWGYGNGNCDRDNQQYYWYYSNGAQYVEGQAQIVQVYQSMSVTYAIQ